MMLAATLTAVGSSTAGVHIPHACSYSIAAQVRGYRPPGFPAGRPFVPHGNAVAATLPAVLRHTSETARDAQRTVARALGCDVPEHAADDAADDVAEVLVAEVTGLMRDIGAPSGLAEFGYRKDDLPALVEGTLWQRRLLAGAPCAVDAGVLDRILTESLHNWWTS
jgi:alcohol dehydrogenase class IV